MEGKRFVYDPYQSLKNKELRELNKMWGQFKDKSGLSVGLFVLRKQSRYDMALPTLSSPGPKQIFVIGVSRSDLVHFKLGSKVKCPEKAWKKHLESRTLHLLKLQAPDVASFELKGFLSKNCQLL